MVSVYGPSLDWSNRVMGPKDRRRWAHGLGLWAPEMLPHWRRFSRRWWDGHSLVNIGTEWTRLDPQRAFKAQFVGYWATMALLVVGMALL